jgi:hypothetical protein
MLHTERSFLQTGESLKNLEVYLFRAICKQEKLPEGFGGSCLGFYLGSHHLLLSPKQPISNHQDYQEQDKSQKNICRKS